MITVSELITKLQTMPQDAAVEFYHEDEDIILTEVDVHYRLDSELGNAVELTLE